MSTFPVTRPQREKSLLLGRPANEGKKALSVCDSVRRSESGKEVANI